MVLRFRFLVAGGSARVLVGLFLVSVGISVRLLVDRGALAVSGGAGRGGGTSVSGRAGAAGAGTGGSLGIEVVGVRMMWVKVVCVVGMD